MEPLVKWNGGLERKVALIKSMMPGEFDRYYEPFLGGGAVYFQMEGRNCLVDSLQICPAGIPCFRQSIQDDVYGLEENGGSLYGCGR